MNKKKLFYIYVLSLTILIPNQASAVNTDITFTCDDEVVRGNKINCIIKTSLVESNIKGIQLNYDIANNFSYVETTTENDWKLLSHNNEGLMAIKPVGTTNNETITNTSFIVSNDTDTSTNYNFKIKNIVLSDGEKDITVEEKNYSIKVLSILDIIDSIKINSKDITLKDGINNYTFNVGTKDSVDLIINLKDENYTFKDNFTSGTITNLKDGDNIKNITIQKNNKEYLNLTFNFQKNVIKDENIEENPKTGNKIIIPILTLFISLILIIVYKKNKMEVK